MYRVLIVVDVQNDFMPGGALPVPNGDAVVPVINELLERDDWDRVFYTRDFHPAETPHFDKWPPHCVEGTPGSEFHPDLVRRGVTILKGRGYEDGYSGFSGKDASGLTLGELIRYPAHVFIVGLATDYCVKATALDAAGRYNDVTVILSACRPVDLITSVVALEEMHAAGVDLVWRLP